MERLDLSNLLLPENKNKLFAILNLAVAILLAVTFFLEVILTHFSGCMSTRGALKELFVFYSIPGTIQLVVSHLIFHRNSHKFASWIFAAPVIASFINVFLRTHIVFVTELYFATLSLLYITFYGWKKWLFGVYVLMSALMAIDVWSFFPYRERIFFLFSFWFILLSSSLMGLIANVFMKMLYVEQFSQKFCCSIRNSKDLITFITKLFSSLDLNLSFVDCEGESLKFPLKESGEKEISLKISDVKIGLTDDLGFLEEKFLIPTLEKVLLPSVLSYKRLVEEKRRKEELLELLIKTVELRDPYTRGHSENVAYYSVKLGKKVGLDSKSLETLFKAALLHDIGKIVIPDKVLLKPGPLTPEEIEIIKLHPEITYKLLTNIRDFEEVAKIAKYHHERWDGSGYPEGLKKEEIPFLSRIIAVADVFDALTSERPYRKPLSTEEALELLKQEPLDPKLVNVAEELFPAIRRPARTKKLIEESAVLDAYRREKLISCFSYGKVDGKKLSIFFISTELYTTDTILREVLKHRFDGFFQVSCISKHQMLIICSTNLKEEVLDVLLPMKVKVEQLL